MRKKQFILSCLPPHIAQEAMNLDSLILYHGNQANIGPTDHDRRVAHDVAVSARMSLTALFERPEVKRIMQTIGAVDLRLAEIQREVGVRS